MVKTIRMMIVFLLSIHAFAQSNASYKTDKDISYYPTSSPINKYRDSRCKLDVYSPKDTTDFATVVWFHGGGLQGGEKYCPEKLLASNLCVVTVNYRLSPQAKAPAYLQDAAAAVAWVFNHIEDYGGDPHKIFIAGHSAGGYLTSMLGLDTKWLAEVGIEADKIAGLLPLSGQTITHSTIRIERGIPSSKVIVDDYAPLNHIRKDCPPLILITGDKHLDLPGRYEENLYLKRLMEIAGHTKTKLFELQGYGHDMVSPALPIMIEQIKIICTRMNPK